MKRRSWLAGLLIAALALAFSAVATPSAAQVGGVLGKVVDEAGNPVADAEIVVSNPSGLGTTKLKTNAKGEYSGFGIPPTDYQIRATKGDAWGQVDRIKIGIGAPTPIPTITMAKAPVVAGRAAMSNAEIEAANKKTAAMKAAFDASEAALAAGNFDEAVRQLTTLATEMPDCDICHLQIGDIHLNKKKDDAAAEAAFKKAIEIKADKPDAYVALSSIYNSQKKFDLANQMSAKATELMAASGSADPVAYVNQGIIMWNQGKMAEAKAQFQKASQLDAKNADAHYWLGMALVNEGNLAEAGTHMKEYLALAPTGQHADTAKAILDSIK